MARLSRLLISSIPWLLLVMFITLRWFDPPLVTTLRLKTFDLYQQIWPREEVKLPVYVIDIDEKSLSQVGQWPWSRSTLATLVEKSFEDYNISALGFDMVFAEEDRTSPNIIAKQWDIDDNLRRQISSLPSNEDIFSSTIAKYPVVAGITFSAFTAPQTGGVLPKAGFATRGGDASDYLSPWQGVTRNLQQIEVAASGIGHFNMRPEIDSIIRSLPTIALYNGNKYPALAIETLRLATGGKSFLAKIDAAGFSSLTIRGPNIEIPVDGDGHMWVYYRPHNRNKYVSASDILDGSLPKGILEGGIVFVGTSAPGLHDLRSSPIDATLPGVEMHLQAVETMMSGEYLSRPANATGVEILFTAMLGILLIILSGHLGAMVSGIVLFIIVAGGVGVGIYMFTAHGYLVDIIYPSIVLMMIFMVHNFIKYIREEASRKAIRTAFSHYLSPELVKILSKSSKGLKLGGEQKEMSVLFSDIRDFTSISEKLTPEELAILLNEYLTPMTDIVMNSGGTIDKYMGDAVMAFWNAPLDIANHPRRACESALDMINTLDGLNIMWKRRGLQEMKIGIGINTAKMSVGNMGSAQRFDYTVMGDGVNLGARLEASCKFYGVSVVVSEYTKEQVEDGIFIPLDKVIVKGKTEPIKVYELVGFKTKNYKPCLEVVHICKGINAYQNRRWVEAEKYYKALKSHPVLKALYLGRIKAYRKKAPAKDWDGSFVATAK